ncbi:MULTISPECIES: 2,3-bisphosphoglycerate-dependent phosphoglycerate mutase [Glycomyces]|uniref:2,3-bisphosphoglycerate-dependent phosphoglycerate mutase n=2 Tax=Glycomyces TaxID=58113 RepID=A0A9X3PKL6_9ACTN|nr:2,3-bisphosphoglycerate-dependent phosphoglycerate mutase [Glycomyces lechevalierae]MDA1387129.1 2,3-bisphosphoglycerate-dependent phosphoglycerate mutase [Glycomyces lechevalierae]MDR7336731.1 2,3-bisphosphoglycerate-dependent phosphoglycerate mutase [Glycomyces lechevalierae]
MTYLAIVRHGQTEWNRIGVFTGWADEGLTEQGHRDSKAAGMALARSGVDWDTVYVSTLRRSAETATVAIAELNHRPTPYIVDWRINERHVGDLEGARRADLAATHGADRVDQWRWGNERPPLMDVDDPRQAVHRSRHPELGMSIPRGESLADVIARVQPWLTQTQEAVAASINVVAFTHGTTFRAIRMLIEGIAPEDAHLMRPANGSLVLYRIDSLPVAHHETCESGCSCLHPNPTRLKACHESRMEY